MSNQNILCRYRYDPLNRLASRTPLAAAMARRFYRDDQLMTELQGEEQCSLFRAPGQLLAQRSQTGSVLLSTDLQGSVLQASSALAQLPIAYCAYGHRQDLPDLPRLPGFNSEQPDPVTGHYLLGNGYRAYNPVLMRFNSPDSWSPFGEGGLNAYSYCVGDPVNRSDPTGHFGGLVGVMSKLLVRGAGRGVGTLKSIGNHIAGSFSAGLSGRGAGAGGRHFTSLQQRAVDTIIASQIPTSSLPARLVSEIENAEYKAKEAVFKVFSTKHQVLGGKTYATEWGFYPSYVFSNAGEIPIPLTRRYPSFSAMVDGVDLQSRIGQQAVENLKSHAQRYISEYSPMSTIRQSRGARFAWDGPKGVVRDYIRTKDLVAAHARGVRVDEL